MTKSTKAIIAMALLSACGGGPDPEPEPVCESVCDGSTITICEPDALVTVECPGPDGCGGEDPFFTCDLLPRLGDPCTEQQWWGGVTWCTSSQRNIISRCHRDLESFPRWGVARICNEGLSCVVIDDVASCLQ